MSRFKPAIETDPAVNITGLLSRECFLCGKRVGNLNDLGRWGVEGVELDCHISCLNGRTPADVSVEYHRRIHDLAGAARMH